MECNEVGLGWGIGKTARPARAELGLSLEGEAGRPCKQRASGDGWLIEQVEGFKRSWSAWWVWTGDRAEQSLGWREKRLRRGSSLDVANGEVRGCLLRSITCAVAPWSNSDDGKPNGASAIPQWSAHPCHSFSRCFTAPGRVLCKRLPRCAVLDHGLRNPVDGY